jgi:hypothetical protein
LTAARHLLTPQSSNPDGVSMSRSSRLARQAHAQVVAQLDG